MNLTSGLQSRIDRARDWLFTAASEGSFRRMYNLASEEWGPVSSEITGYGAHVFSWLFSVSGLDADRRMACKSAEWLVRHFCDHQALPVEPDSDLLYFFDTGIAARGLFAASIALERKDFWDASIAIGTLMRRFQRGGLGGSMLPIMKRDGSDFEPNVPWWSNQPGPYQRKAALIWKLLKRSGDYDDLDFRFLFDEAWTRHAIEKADLLHPFSYSCEALLMGDASGERARVAFAALEACIQKAEVLRSDVFAQYVRLLLLHGQPLSMASIDRLCNFQHESGGFHFRTVRGQISSHLSVHATMFAIQALGMAQDPARLKFPGLLRRRELVIV
jgi:hypothetical protein